VLSRGNFLNFFQQPIALGLFIASALFLGWSAWRHLREARSGKTREDAA
jgi:TctA family transporter